MLARAAVAIIAQHLELVDAEGRVGTRIVEHDKGLVEILLGGDRLHELDVFPDEVVGIIAEHFLGALVERSEEHTSELQSLMRISYAVFCLKKKKKNTQNNIHKKQLHRVTDTQKHYTKQLTQHTTYTVSTS